MTRKNLATLGAALLGVLITGLTTLCPSAMAHPLTADWSSCIGTAAAVELPEIR